MIKKRTHNLLSWLVYSILIYILLIPLKTWIIAISISLIIGFLFGLLNDILTQLRILNGEKIKNLSNKKTEETPIKMIKS